MNRLLGVILLAALVAPVSAATTQPAKPRDIAPKQPPVVETVGQVIDRRRPVYVPDFAVAETGSRLQAERDWAYTHTYPIGWWWAGYPFWGPRYWTGYRYGGYYGHTPNHGFYR